MYDGLAFLTLIILIAVTLTMSNSWDLLKSFPKELAQGEMYALIIAGFSVLSTIYAHFSIRRAVANHLLKKLANELGNDHDAYKQFMRAFNKSTAAYRPMFLQGPAGWNEVTEQTIDEIINEANDYIQALNDQFTNPSGNGRENSQV